MNLLVAICTYNRAEMLRNALESLCAMDQPASAKWSVLVMNNRSTDHTDAVISEFAGRLPISRGYQPIQGLSNARNAVIESEQASVADYILWTDDDIRVDPTWLAAYESAFIQSAEAALFGGNVRPLFEVDPPPWILEGWDAFKDAFAERYFDAPLPLEIQGPRIPYGANFAVRGVEQRSLRYDPKLGVVGTKWLGGEEVALMKQLMRQGHSGWWVPKASVRHCIPKQRMSMEFLGKYFRGQGMTESIRIGEDTVPWFRKPPWLWRKTAGAWAAYFLSRIGGGARRWSHHYRDANVLTGRLFC